MSLPARLRLMELRRLRRRGCQRWLTL